jgi:hypothetical protein
LGNSNQLGIGISVSPFSELDPNLPLEAKELYSVAGLEKNLTESENLRKEQIYREFQPVKDLE